MAVTTTARLGLTRWSIGADPLTRAQLDASHAALEANVAMFAQGTLAARPAFGKSGRFYHVDSGSGIGVTYYDTGAAWVPVSPDLSPYATTAALTSGLAGKAATVHQHAAADVTSGIFAAARLGSGTANSSTILFGDGVWRSAPSGTIAAMTDATVTSPTTGQVLRYNAGTSKWVNATLTTADVSGLDAALGDKAPTVHTHTKSQITDFAHSHLIADLPVAASGTSSATLLVRADDSRLSNARTPTGAASGHLAGTYPSPTVTRVGPGGGGTSAATTPDDYNGVAMWNVRTSASLGLPDSSTNAVLLGFRVAADASGFAQSYEYAHTDAGNVYRRRGATTTWGAWQIVEKAGVASVFADDATLVGIGTAQLVVRVKHNGSAYPSRPAFPPNCVVSWAGPTDPSAQAGLVVSADDDWIYRP